MRLVLALGRLSVRAQPFNARIATVPSSLRSFPRPIFRTPWTKSRNQSWRNTRFSSRVLLAAGNGVLGAAAFVELSGDENGDGDDTGEKRMLELSRDEIKKTVDEDDKGFRRLRHQIALYVSLYIWEPISTGFRFLQLVVIFVPVILSVPAIWVGTRQPDRDNERIGTLWWYGFLVKAMEWAGPAFIKVCDVYLPAVPGEELTPAG